MLQETNKNKTTKHNKPRHFTFSIYTSVTEEKNFRSLKIAQFRTVYTEAHWKAFKNTEITEKGSCDPETETSNKQTRFSTTTTTTTTRSKNVRSGVNSRICPGQLFVFSNPVARSSSLFGK